MSLFIEKLFTDPIYFFRYVVIIVISIVLHELAHGFAAMSEGDDTPQSEGHITPNPVVHMGIPALIMLMFVGMTWGQMPVNPSNFKHKWGHAWVAAAGPLMNVALAALCCVLVALSMTQGWAVISPEFFGLMAFINVFLFLFNLLPVPPLDGFTVVSDFFPSLKPIRNSQVGLFLLIVIFTVPFIGGGLASLAMLTVRTAITTLVSWAG
ncbi:site-2 protease family protein [filamentous cyanobacterium LEGE 11480]|uniref:Site-2 protease family protein n=1 Tax=Romeriopsis navalis LEGE 11480 TaxID=2777977 RepID=A0A928Z5B3_9CYAN|nr:site-2 protease family protein [Romeriopsis navalis]MBE9031293.1 site-2 protease family protein [Romeriopsis navalis LEGE 11480]